ATLEPEIYMWILDVLFVAIDVIEKQEEDQVRGGGGGGGGGAEEKKNIGACIHLSLAAAHKWWDDNLLGQMACLKNFSEFKFELGWLTREGFFDLVSSFWQQERRGETAIQIWQNKMRGWKQQLLELIDELNKKADILREEEDEDGACIADKEELKSHITSYYKNLFGKPDITSVDQDESFIQDISQVSDTENEILTANFTIDEVKKLFEKIIGLFAYLIIGLVADRISKKLDGIILKVKVNGGVGPFLFCYGLAKEYELQYSHLFGCGIGTTPFKYLGIPIGLMEYRFCKKHKLTQQMAL
ncbi:hypothetical protein ACJX0J_028946, partial [Zea mays]